MDLIDLNSLNFKTTWSKVVREDIGYKFVAWVHLHRMFRHRFYFFPFFLFFFLVCPLFDS